MSSRKAYINDLRRRLVYARYAENYIISKYLLNDSVIPFGLKKDVSFRLYLLPMYFSIVQSRNRCIYTYRSRSVYRKFKISRLQLRENIWKLLVPGVTLASW